MRTTTRSALAVSVLAAVLLGGAACKSDNKSTGGAPPPTATQPASGGTIGGGGPDAAATPQAGIPNAQQVAALQRYVTEGRLDEPVFATMRDKGAADALVVLDDDKVTDTVKKLAAAQGIALTDDKLVEMKAAAYAEIKRQVAASAPQYMEIVTDFENFGVAQVRFTSADSMLQVLQRPEVAGIREIEEYRND